MKSLPLFFSVWATMSCLTGLAAVPEAVSLGACSGALRAPARVAVDSGGTIYVSDPQAGQVAMFDSWCRPLDTRGGFARPLGLAIDPQGRIYLAEELKGCVTVFDPQWKPLYQLGIGEGEFLLPNFVAVGQGPSGVTVYVSDSRANAVKVYNEAGSRFQFGGLGTANGQFDFPAGLCLSPAGELFVVDQNNDRVQAFDRAGNFLRAFGLGGGGAAAPSGRPQGAYLDATGRLYVADTFQGVVKVFDPASGALLSTVAGFGQSPGQLASPAGLTLDRFNRLLVTSAGTSRLELYGIDSFVHMLVRPSADYVALGADLVLQVVAGGGPASFQWQKDGINLASATNATLTIAGIDQQGSGGYSVVVTGASGIVTSSVAPIRIQAPPMIVQNPQSLSVLLGSNVVMEVGATGSALQYQWQLNGLNIKGQTSRTLVLTDVQTFQSGAYSVLVSNQVGSVLSAPAMLTVTAPPNVMEIVSASMTGDGFHLMLNADPGFHYSLDTSGDLFHWELLSDLVLDAGLEEVVDFGATNFAKGFYRLRWGP